jgi:hypothetical protein
LAYLFQFSCYGTSSLMCFSVFELIIRSRFIVPELLLRRMGIPEISDRTAVWPSM